MRLAARLEAMGQAKYIGTTRRSGRRNIWSGRINLDERTLYAPLSWATPQKIFVNSMSDLFHVSVPIDFIHHVWEVMERANWHMFQILTKRPRRMKEILCNEGFRTLPNVWLGTSVECQEYVWRTHELRQAPAHIRFVSFEPLIGRIGAVDLTDIHWVIVGGESGPHARRMEREWVDEVRAACKSQKIPFFFKQWGGVTKKKNGRLLDGRTWDEYPIDPRHSEGRRRKRVAA
jgi:protein gp37